MPGFAFRWVVLFWVVAIPVLGTSSSVFAQDARPLTELPENVKTTDKEVGIFVDWKNVANSQVQVFIVNRSDKPLTLSHAYGNCYLKLEVQNESKKWERFEAHSDELCGTGLGTFELKPGQWVQQPHGISLVRKPIQAAPKIAPKAAPKDTETVIADIEASIAKIRDFMSRARLTPQGLADYNAKIKGLEDQLEEAKAVQAKNKAMAAQIKDRKETPKPVNNSENRLVRLRMYDFACRAKSNTSSMLFDNFDAVKNCKRDVYSIRYGEVDFLRKVIFNKVKFVPIQAGPVPFGDPQSMAVSALERSWHPVEEVTATLNEIIAGKDEKLKAIAIKIQKKLANR